LSDTKKQRYIDEIDKLWTRGVCQTRCNRNNPQLNEEAYQPSPKCST